MLTQQEKRRSVVMLVLVVLMAFAETVGVVSIMPFLSVLARPEIIQENEQWWQNVLNDSYQLIRLGTANDN